MIRLNRKAIEILARLISISEADILKSLEMLKSHSEKSPAYICFFIKKSSGGKREILAPVEPLKALLRLIYLEILERFPLNHHIHGFRRNRSIVSNAKAHLQNGANHLVNWDIKDCFPSTSEIFVQEVYEKTIGKNLRQEGVENVEVDEIISILTSLSTLRYGRAKQKVLPMGSPTSPALLNLVLQPFDLILARHLNRINQESDASLVYTRYGDDISISSPKPLPSAIFGIVPSLLSKFGYRINQKKTKMMHRNTSSKPLEVTGIVLGKERLLLSDRWLKKAELFAIKFRDNSDPSVHDKNTLRGIIGIAKMIYGNNLPPRLANTVNINCDWTSIEDAYDFSYSHRLSDFDNPFAR